MPFGVRARKTLNIISKRKHPETFVKKAPELIEEVLALVAEEKKTKIFSCYSVVHPPLRVGS